MVELTKENERDDADVGTAHPYLAAVDESGGIHWYAGQTYQRYRIRALPSTKDYRKPRTFFKRAPRYKGVFSRVWQSELEVPESVWKALVSEDTSADALALLDDTIAIARRVVSNNVSDTTIYRINPERA